MKISTQLGMAGVWEDLSELIRVMNLVLFIHEQWVFQGFRNFDILNSEDS